MRTLTEVAAERRLDFSMDRLYALLERNHEGIFWRHDVDFNLECARSMALLEYDFNVTSTYYLRALPEDYDPANSEFWETVKVIQACGHNIGVHVDLRLPRQHVVSALVLMRACNDQMGVLASDARWPKTDLVSLHCPPRSALFRRIPRYLNAMDPVWEHRYVADSRGSFRFAQPETMISHHCTVQINLHPEWWFLPAEQAQAMREREEAKP